MIAHASESEVTSGLNACGSAPRPTIGFPPRSMSCSVESGVPSAVLLGVSSPSVAVSVPPPPVQPASPIAPPIAPYRRTDRRLTSFSMSGLSSVMGLCLVGTTLSP